MIVKNKNTYGMKTFIYISFVIGILALNGCHYKDGPTCPTCENFSDGFVIGFDPCTGVGEPNGGSVGFIINIPSQKDTVVNYSFPIGLYQFPPEYFKNYELYCIFPDTAWSDFPIKIKYRHANNSEKVFPICRANINTSYFNEYIDIDDDQIIILSITN